MKQRLVSASRRQTPFRTAKYQPGTTFASTSTGNGGPVSALSIPARGQTHLCSSAAAVGSIASRLSVFLPHLHSAPLAAHLHAEPQLQGISWSGGWEANVSGPERETRRAWASALLTLRDGGGAVEDEKM